MPARRLFCLASTALVAAVLVACGSDAPGPAEFGNRLPDRSSGDPGSTGIAGDDDGSDNGGVSDACATSTASADQLPLHMVVVLDKSGSMCEYTSSTNPRDCGNPSSKWQQVTKALSGFFTSAQSKGITVSLIAFPNNDSCNASSYATPLAADVALPDTGGTLSSKIAQLTGDGSTPTRPALEGALNYAKSVDAKLAGKGKVAVVMATDGYPQDCSNNSINAASTVASNAKGTIPTYVIGVGNLLNDLNALAAAGGTSKAYIVSTSNQGSVGNEFATALSQIRGASLACEYALPAPPPGETLDYQRVNVQYSAGSAAAQTLKYSDACTSGEGWRYDDTDNPTKILLCPATCDKAKADAAAKIDLVLGCQTNGSAVK